MKGKQSRLLVVDASVARSAGNTEHPVSSSCRNTLLSILDICHRVVMTEAIQEEWNRHASIFTLKWLGTMTAKKKIHRSEGANLERQEEALKLLSTNEQENLWKDLCLIEAACDGDGIVVTRDDGIVRIWEKCQDRFGLPKPIRWLNPLTDDRQTLERL